MKKAHRILLSEGSSLSARETVTALGLAGHKVEIVSSDQKCLSRFSRFVTKLHQVPPSGRAPEAYLAAVLSIISRRSIDVLLPTHEQAYLFAAANDQLPKRLGVALAAFSAFEQVQSKANFAKMLAGLGVPQPETKTVFSMLEMAEERDYPYFVKTAFGTASAGVWRISGDADKKALIHKLDQLGAFIKGVVVQKAAVGPLERCQAVFNHGRLLAWHTYRQIAEGPG